MTPEQDLEALLKASVAEAAKRRSDRTRPGAVASPVSERHRLAFTDPKNWNLTGQVQLVHRDGNVESLLGLFDELIHVSSPHTRKLVATQLAPGMNPRIEYVTGNNWLADDTLEKKRRIPDHTIRLLEDLSLEMGAFASTAEIDCTLVGGGVSRIVLVHKTVFEGHTPKLYVEVPAGVDLIETLTRDTKERIWDELQRRMEAQ